ncbi:uncharacterized protein LOC117317795 [Pecten maximus]|uniref:uncharacterized protein LOC117317795 n=1 Tax=Pecten maximus TaxID=6579 RepID=UPI001458BA74|nr:uncharacterized protein LOC117317795 [Pecten maximus]XP_033728632.1 uncharacterized protein LOC117317795 [Pecten maximus]
MSTIPHSVSVAYDWLMDNIDIDDICHGNCSGHGGCLDGKCACLVQFTGGTCQDPNNGYFVAFGCIFIMLSIVSFVQLCLCIRNEYISQGRKSLKEAIFRLTGQKLLYALTIFATAIRGIYFFTKLHVSELVSNNLWTAYYPLLLSCFSFIVCFWAEAFHVEFERNQHRFLGKSFIGFFIFNLFIYCLLFVNMVLLDVVPNDAYADLITKVTNGIFAGTMIIAVIFFLIYGVEVYFKVRGAFTNGDSDVDPWQLSMSRLGLVSQAMFQFCLALFLLSDITKDVWKHRLPILSQNFYDIGFRVVEFSVAVWFPCVLWNCKSPENLWVLNPKKLFSSAKTVFDESTEDKYIRSTDYQSYGSCNPSVIDGKHDCWICYDPERQDAGHLIQPCECKGDMATVHHECLRKWLMECIEDDRDFKCKVCNVKYKLHVGSIWLPKGMKPRHWVQTFFSLIIMVGCPFAAYTISHTLDVTQTYINVLIIGITLLVEFSCLRMLAINLGICYKRGHVSTLSIAGRIKTLPKPKPVNEGEQILQQQSSESESDTNTAVISTADQIVTDEERTNVIRTGLTNSRSCSISIEAVIENHRL